uniref:hypothetical protein n=1 Tax=Myxococcus vastator TaxID=2709664 RepID=UPI0019683D8E
GGGIRVEVGALTGTGEIQAKGNALSSTRGGGGGRVAVYYDEATSAFAWGNISAAGHGGGAGTIFLKSNSALYGDLVFDNKNRIGNASDVRPTEIPASPTGMQTFRDFIVVRKASVVTLDALDVTRIITVDSSSRLQSQNISLP